jgi:hypothetical protein
MVCTSTSGSQPGRVRRTSAGSRSSCPSSCPRV